MSSSRSFGQILPYTPIFCHHLYEMSFSTSYFINNKCHHKPQIQITLTLNFVNASLLLHSILPQQDASHCKPLQNFHTAVLLQPQLHLCPLQFSCVREIVDISQNVSKGLRPLKLIWYMKRVWAVAYFNWFLPFSNPICWIKFIIIQWLNWIMTK